MTRMSMFLLVAMLAVASAHAQALMGTEPASAAPRSLGGEAPTNARGAPPAPPSCGVPAHTLVDLEILDTLNSYRNKRGDKFRIRVTTPVVLNAQALIAAETLGVGEVVHAAAARGGGAPGELLIAARSLNIGEQTAQLRGLKLGVAGEDNSGMALGVSFAAGPFAMFIRGREIEIPAGTRVNARLAQDLKLPATSCLSPGIVLSAQE